MSGVVWVIFNVSNFGWYVVFVVMFEINDVVGLFMFIINVMGGNVVCVVVIICFGFGNE